MGYAAILPAARAVVPSDYGSAPFARLTGGVWRPGGGTTCAFLLAYLLWVAGCRDERIVNYEAPDGSTRWHVGEGISRLVNGARALGALDESAARFSPLPGDFYFLTEGPPSTEHVGVFLGHGLRGTWRTADAGQKNERGVECARVRQRTLVNGRLSTAAGARTLRALVRVRKLPYAARARGGSSLLLPLGLAALVAAFVFTE